MSQGLEIDSGPCLLGWNRVRQRFTKITQRN